MTKVIVGLLTIMLVASLVSGCYQAPAPAPTPPEAAPAAPAATPPEAAPAAPPPPATVPAPPPTEKAPAPASGTVHQVTIKDFAFSPAQITIKVGDTVTWTNQDSIRHTVTGSGFDSGNLASGQSWSYTFKVAGTFTYKCAIHPSMQGQVTMGSGGASGGQSGDYNY